MTLTYALIRAYMLFRGLLFSQESGHLPQVGEVSFPLSSEEAQTSGHPVVHLHSIDVHIYQVTETDLNQLGEAGLSKSLNALFAATLFGALVTLILWGLTAGFDSSVTIAAATAAYIVLGVLLAFFALRALGDYQRARELLNRFKS